MTAVSPVSVDEAKAYLRIDSASEDAAIAGFVRSATAMCEAFTGQTLIAREGTEMVAATGAWTRLSASPVRSITSVTAVAADGMESVLAAGAYRVDIDARGDGWVRVSSDARRAVVSFSAGLAEDWNQVPEPLRHGVVRLAAHLYGMRGENAEPPAAVTALWRPWRRMRLR